MSMLCCAVLTPRGITSVAMSVPSAAVAAMMFPFTFLLSHVCTVPGARPMASARRANQQWSVRGALYVRRQRSVQACAALRAEVRIHLTTLA